MKTEKKEESKKKPGTSPKEKPAECVKDSAPVKPTVADPSVKPAQDTAAPAPAPVATAAAQSLATPAVEPKKGHRSCWIVVVVLVVLIYLFFQFIPFFSFGMLGRSQDSAIPTLPNSNQNIAVTPPATKTNENKNTSTKPKNSNTSNTTSDTTSKPVTETPPNPTETPPTSSGPQTSFTKQEEIDYFIKIAITDESNNYQETPLHRWKKNEVIIRYFDNATNLSDLACANETINILNSLSNTTKFKNDNNNGLYDIEVHFVPHSQIAQVVGDAGGYMNYDVNSASTFVHTFAYVPIDKYSDSVRCHYIRHEITHAATGLIYNLRVTQGGYHYSIFNVPIEGWSDYINIDKDLIKMMYNTGIETGLNAAQARAFLNNASW